MKSWLPLLFVVGAVSCAHATPPSTAAREPVPRTKATHPAADASYVLEFRMSPKPVVHVHITVLAQESHLTFGCDEWGGIEHCENEIANVSAHDSATHALTVQHSGHYWSVDTSPGTRATLDYALAPTRPNAMANESDRFYPVVTDRYLHFIGHTALLAPRESKEHTTPEREIELVWRGFREAGWNVACSFGTESELHVRRSYERFVHSVFVAGDYEIHRTDNAEAPIILVMRPGAWKFGATDFLSTAVPVVSEERKLFRDRATPLVIVASPMLVDADVIDGTMLSDSIDLFLPRAGRLIPNPLLALLLSHEYFHNWDTLVMRPSEDEGAGIMWFTEGFAEFYMRRVAYRAGRISRNDYLFYLNRALLAYAKSPSNREPNERIRSDFWKSPDVNRLPYNRGQIVALVIDAQLRAAGGALTLDDFVRRLADDARSTNVGVTSESVLKKLGEMTSAAFEAQIRRIVIDGELAIVPPNALAPCALLKGSDVPMFEFAPDGQSACAATL